MSDLERDKSLEQQAELYSKTRLMAIEDCEDKCWDLRTEMEIAYIQGWVDRGHKEFNDEIRKK